ncbi:MAG: peptidylprolyl isomerase [Gemmatimonadota bacterium]
MRVGCEGQADRLFKAGVVPGLLLIFGSAFAQPATALQEPPALEPPWPADVLEVDRVVAIVGDTAILLSDVRNEMFRLEAQGTQIPPEDSPQWGQVARQVVNALADLVIWLQEAKRGGLSAPEEQVEERAEEYYQQARQGFASDQALADVVEESGMNMLQYRQMLRSNAETEVLLEVFRGSLAQRPDLPPVVINDSEVQAYFLEQAGGQTRPPMVSFNQLIITPFPDGAARDSAIARAVRINLDLNAGEDFAVVARRYSDDDGTREAGGELGWMRRDALVKEFADAAWQARPGQTIGPISTRFGLHIIKIENSRGGERFIRHILIEPELDEDDFQRARAFAGELADSLRAGVDPERLQRANTEVAKEQIRFDNIPIQQLTGQLKPADVATIATPKDDKVYGPFEIQRSGPTEYVIIHMLRYRPEGPVELDDFRDVIRQNLRVSKQIDVLLAEMRARTFVDIKL